MHVAASRLSESRKPEGAIVAAKPAAVRHAADGRIPAGDARLVITASAHARLLTLADQAPLEALPLAPRTLAHARTLGYNHIGQVRGTAADQLAADFGTEHADELRRALTAFGLAPETPSGRDIAD